MVSKSSTSLAPGFRFHPTDEELVRYYLRRKICGKSFRFDAISEIDIYKAEPWDLPGMAKLKTRDLEWYFFSVLDKKYGNGSRTNRATERGYWKTTGKDRPVYHRSLVVGMKKTLVYHSGRAPKGQRSNWVMHEYRLVDEELQKAGILQDAFVLCRIFQKSGSGPKNGEQYGAPFVEEEWEDDEVGIMPKEEAAEEVEVADDAYLDGNDLEQVLAAEIPTDDGNPLPLNYYFGENTTLVNETTESGDDSQKLSAGSGEYDYGNNQSEEQKTFNLPVQYDMQETHVKHEFIAESSSKTVNPQGMDYLLDEPYIDAAENFQFGDGAFLETNDLANPIDPDTAGFDMLEEYLTFFDANGDDTFDLLPEEAGCDVSGESSDTKKDVEEAIKPAMSSKQIEHFDDSASSNDSLKLESGYQHPFMKQASKMLGSIPAPPAFASEFPPKDVALHLNSASQPSSSVHVTAGMIQIRNTSMGMGRQGTDWFLEKQGRYNVTLSFGFSRGDDNSTVLESAVRILPGKTNNSSASNSWFYFIFFWVLLLSISFKIGTWICAQ